MKKRMLLSSIMMIVLCVSLLTGATFALFTSESKTSITITSGKVEVVSSVSNLKTYSLDVEQENGLFENGGKAYLDSENGKIILTNITPGDKASFKLTVENKSNVTIKYCVKYQVYGDLLDALTIKEIENGVSKDVKSRLSPEWTLVYQEGKLHEKEISIYFPIDKTNQYQDSKAEIEITVYAVQGNDPTWDGSADISWYNDSSTEFVINNAFELQGLSKLVNEGNSFYGKTIKLGQNIDLSTTYDLYELQPIGSSSCAFEGTFDGNGFTISNLKLTNNPSNSNIGLFGFTKNGAIKNLTINNATVKGDLNVGVVAGSPYTSTYSSILLIGLIKVDGRSYVGGVGGKNAYANWTDVTIDASDGSYVKAVSTFNGINYRTYVGGVVGFMGEGTHTFKNIESNINVFGDVCDVGGIVGIAHYGNNFENIVCSGNVTLNNVEEGQDKYMDALEVGGIAGTWMNSEKDITFTNISFTGKVLSTFVDEGSSVCEIKNYAYNGLIGKQYYLNATSNPNKLIIDGQEQDLYKVSTNEVTINNVEYICVPYTTVLETYNTLESIIESGSTNIYLPAGSYVLPDSSKGKTLTIRGSKDTLVETQDDGSYEGCDYSLDGATVTFENITITTDSSTYSGYARLKATYNNCTINGTYTLYGDSTFNNCTLNVSGNVYNIWTWGAENVTFNNCTFNSDGKALLLYGIVNTNLTVNDCTFNDLGGLTDLKAAIEIGNDYNKSYTLVITNTKVFGYEVNNEGIITNTNLWANKNSMDKAHLSVSVDGNKVY